MAPCASEAPTPRSAVAPGVGQGPGAEWVSVVICTKDRPDDLARATASVRASGPAGRAAEIVVVEEVDVARELPGVRYVHLGREGRGFGHARNAGVRKAQGDLIVFLDDDCEAAPGWLEALTAPLREAPDLLGVAGAVLVRGCGAIGYAENILGFPGGGLRYRHAAGGRAMPTRHLSTCNCAYRREAIQRAGGFREDARMGGEDYLLAERVAALGPCVYVPDAVVYHRTRGRLGAVLQWFMRRGESEMALLRATADRAGYLGFLLRSSWTLRMLFLLVLLARWPRLAGLLLPAALTYYGAILWRYRFARRYPSHRRAWWLVPVVKGVMDLGTEVGRWKGLLAGARR